MEEFDDDEFPAEWALQDDAGDGQVDENQQEGIAQNTDENYTLTEGEEPESAAADEMDDNEWKLMSLCVALKDKGVELDADAQNTLRALPSSQAVQILTEMIDLPEIEDASGHVAEAVVRLQAEAEAETQWKDEDWAAEGWEWNDAEGWVQVADKSKPASEDASKKKIKSKPKVTILKQPEPAKNRN